MADFLDCTNKDIPDEALMAALMAQDDEGNWAIRTMYVDASDDAIDCTNKNLTISQMLRKCLGVDGSGKLALRLVTPAP